MGVHRSAPLTVVAISFGFGGWDTAWGCLCDVKSISCIAKVE